MAALPGLLSHGGPVSRVSPDWSTAGQVALVTLALALDLIIWGGDTRLRDGGSVPAVVVIAGAVVMFALLLGRGRWPLSIFVLSLAYTLGWAWLLPTYEPFTAVLIALHHLARHLSRRPALVCLAVTALPWAANTANAAASGKGPVAIGVTFMLWFVIAGGVWTAGRFGFRSAGREARQAAEALRAVEDERLRLARELHDIVSHSVSAIMFQAAGARRALPHLDARVDDTLEVIETTATQASRELRRLLGLLHEPVDDDAADALDPAATLDQLPALIATIRSTGVSVQLQERGHPRTLDRSVEHAAFRVVQEALSNVMKHGGPGASAEVKLHWRAEGVVVTVRSRAGSQQPRPAVGPSGFGLRGLGERVMGVGGTLQTGPDPDGTFSVVAALPAAGVVPAS